MNEIYMRMAEELAKASKAEKLKVGALAVRFKRIIGEGVNGTPPGTSNVCEDESMHTLPQVIHAEQNLVYKAARDGSSTAGATLFCTVAPCFECSKAILSAGFTNVYYRHAYKNDAGIDFLREQGIPCEAL